MKYHIYLKLLSVLLIFNITIIPLYPSITYALERDDSGEVSDPGSQGVGVPAEQDLSNSTDGGGWDYDPRTPDQIAEDAGSIITSSDPNTGDEQPAETAPADISQEENPYDGGGADYDPRTSEQIAADAGSTITDADGNQIPVSSLPVLRQPEESAANPYDGGGWDYDPRTPDQIAEDAGSVSTPDGRGENPGSSLPVTGSHINPDRQDDARDHNENDSSPDNIDYRTPGQIAADAGSTIQPEANNSFSAPADGLPPLIATPIFDLTSQEAAIGASITTGQTVGIANEASFAAVRQGEINAENNFNNEFNAGFNEAFTGVNNTCQTGACEAGKEAGVKARQAASAAVNISVGDANYQLKPEELPQPVVNKIIEAESKKIDFSQATLSLPDDQKRALLDAAARRAHYQNPTASESQIVAALNSLAARLGVKVEGDDQNFTISRENYCPACPKEADNPVASLIKLGLSVVLTADATGDISKLLETDINYSRVMDEALTAYNSSIVAQNDPNAINRNLSYVRTGDLATAAYTTPAAYIKAVADYLENNPNLTTDQKADLDSIKAKLEKAVTEQNKGQMATSIVITAALAEPALQAGVGSVVGGVIGVVARTPLCRIVAEKIGQGVAGVVDSGIGSAVRVGVDQIRNVGNAISDTASGVIDRSGLGGRFDPITEGNRLARQAENAVIEQKAAAEAVTKAQQGLDDVAALGDNTPAVGEARRDFEQATAVEAVAEAELKKATDELAQATRQDLNYIQAAIRAGTPPRELINNGAVDNLGAAARARAAQAGTLTDDVGGQLDAFGQPVNPNRSLDIGNVDEIAGQVDNGPVVIRPDGNPVAVDDAIRSLEHGQPVVLTTGADDVASFAPPVGATRGVDDVLPGRPLENLPDGSPTRLDETPPNRNFLDPCPIGLQSSKSNRLAQAFSWSQVLGEFTQSSLLAQNPCSSVNRSSANRNPQYDQAFRDKFNSLSSTERDIYMKWTAALRESNHNIDEILSAARERIIHIANKPQFKNKPELTEEAQIDDVFKNLLQPIGSREWFKREKDVDIGELLFFLGIEKRLSSNIQARVVTNRVGTRMNNTSTNPNPSLTTPQRLVDVIGAAVILGGAAVTYLSKNGSVSSDDVKTAAGQVANIPSTVIPNGVAAAVSVTVTSDGQVVHSPPTVSSVEYPDVSIAIATPTSTRTPRPTRTATPPGGTSTTPTSTSTSVPTNIPTNTATTTPTSTPVVTPVVTLSIYDPDDNPDTGFDSYGNTHTGFDSYGNTQAQNAASVQEYEDRQQYNLDFNLAFSAEQKGESNNCQTEACNAGRVAAQKAKQDLNQAVQQAAEDGSTVITGSQGTGKAPLPNDPGALVEVSVPSNVGPFAVTGVQVNLNPTTGQPTATIGIIPQKDVSSAHNPGSTSVVFPVPTPIDLNITDDISSHTTDFPLRPQPPLPVVDNVVFIDKNLDGKMNPEESPAPIAGFPITIQPLNKKNTLLLLNGWNLMTLTAIPERSFTASSLISTISAQSGNATSVSKLDNGVWKTYVKRGDRDFSGDDFVIEIGQAYFVKTIKTATFTFKGQDLVSPTNVLLNPGWNAIGLPLATKDYKADSLINALNANQAGADAAARFESGLWDTFVQKSNEGFGEDFAIEPPRGYIIRVKNNTNFSP